MGVTWGWLIVFYLFLGGISGGAAALNGFNGITNIYGERIQKASAILAPFPVMLGLLLLIFDLHRPTKFYLLIFNYNFNSIMAWGVILLALFSLVSLFTLYRSWKEKPAGKALSVANIVLGLGLAGYTGLLLSAINHNPIWGTPVLPVLFLVSAISTGIAGTLLISNVIPMLKEQEGSLKRLGKTDLGLIFTEIVIILILFLGWAYTAQGSTIIQALLFEGYALIFWLGFILLGLFLPLILLLLEINGKIHSRNITIMIASLVLLGGAVLRIIVVFSGQTIF